jgi:hypothetical protein
MINMVLDPTNQKSVLKGAASQSMGMPLRLGNIQFREQDTRRQMAESGALPMTKRPV